MILVRIHHGQLESIYSTVLYITNFLYNPRTLFWNEILKELYRYVDIFIFRYFIPPNIGILSAVFAHLFYCIYLKFALEYI